MANCGQWYTDVLNPEKRCRSCVQTNERTIADLHAKNQQTVDKYEKIVQQVKADNEFLKLDMELLQEWSNNDFSTRYSPLHLQGDVEIVVQGEKLLQAHRFILASKSVVFSKMFQSRMLKNETGVVRIQDTTLPIMQAVITFCYTAQIEFSEEVPPEEVLKVAHKHAIYRLRDVCAKELVTRINERNLAEMLRLSGVCESKELQEAAKQYFQDNFESAFPFVVKALGG